jgi:hypothetical protein
VPSAAVQLKRNAAPRATWRTLSVDGHRQLAYSARFGRLYLVAVDDRSNNPLFALLGLRDSDRRTELDDPAIGIEFDRSNLQWAAPVTAPRALCRAYDVLYQSRRILPLAATVAILRWLARLDRRRRVASGPDIGRLVYAVERRTGREDCYPRALLTYYLCRVAGLDCELTVGVLAPTRKMHIWCSVDGRLPYEALPEHYLYLPLLRLTVTSAAG